MIFSISAADVSTGERRMHEVIGEPVELDRYPGERFALHMNPFVVSPTRWEPMFCISHLGTGARFAYGDTIEQAIEHARFRQQERTPHELAQAIARMYSDCPCSSEIVSIRLPWHQLEN